ncbi:RDD family protein [Desulfosporosinus acididurans]|uniref:RDD family protein n=1 Tax=Desulfosporosinus acididurans TaxID=476652 RepID=A0A0J1IHJ1_9FIRM|nr:RDD family protein [Desulfosporosinus acididurans]KLU64146.1 RDD family protein [Desulfosporosinus acididurans]
MEVNANFWKRLLAYFIDNAIYSTILILLTVPFWLATALGGWQLLLLLNIIVGWLYFALMESSAKQATLGKLALGIIVTDLFGQRISFGVATGRYFGKVLSLVPLCAGFVMAAFTERKQALHDVLLGTLVLNKNSSVVNNRPHQMPQGQNVRPILCGVTGNYAGQMIQIDDKGLIIGRDPLSCNIIVPSEAISRMHCIIKYDPRQNSFTLTDTCSSNGTFLASGVRLGKGQAIILKSGDRFFLAVKDNMFEVKA